MTIVYPIILFYLFTGWLVLGVIGSKLNAPPMENIDQAFRLTLVWPLVVFLYVSVIHRRINEMPPLGKRPTVYFDD